MEYFISLVLTISQMSSLVLICMSFLKLNQPAKKYIPHFFLLVTSTYVVSHLPNFAGLPLKSIAGIACVIVFVCVVFRGNLLIKTLCVFFGYAVAFGLETAMVFLFVYLFGISTQTLHTQIAPFLITAAASNILMLSLSFLLYKFRKAKKAWERISVSGWLIMLLFPLITLLTMIILLQITLAGTIVSSFIILDAGGLLIANIILFFLLNRLVAEERAQKKSLMLQHQVSSQMQTVNILLASQAAQGRITHDFKHHWNAVSTLLHQEQMEKAITYVDAITNTPLLSTEVVSCGNPIIDAVLNQKYAVAKRENIKMSFLLNHLAAFPFSAEETVVVLANLLDNAIEACCKLNTQREIRVKIQCEKNQTVLAVRNTTDILFLPLGELPLTTKDSPWLHGFGLQSVYTILSRYNAIPAIKVENGWFLFSTVIF